MSEFLFFWGGIYSNWYKSNFEIDGVKFNTVEQYMMWKKALLFGDYEVAEKVMQEKEPKKQKSLGREVKAFKDDEWIRHCKKFVFDGCYAKFTQNERLKSEILSSGVNSFVEASPIDLRWGCGLSQENPFINDRNNWPGENWLGDVLDKVKGYLKSH